MKQILLLTAIAVLLAACAAPTAAPPANQPAAGQDLPEVTVFRSPT
jgi:PBP1b-binding outer membrane lipoprotein LpoB